MILNILPRTLEYKLCPKNDRLSALLDNSRFQGFAQAIAALSSQLAPSSPKYYIDGQYQ